MDSADMTHKDWGLLATLIEKNYYDYDGFLILHGTDTMAYTASALSFILENLAKPVIITGSQIPFCEVINDARRNIIAAMIIAGNIDLPEVCILFNNVLIRGNRTTKVDSWGLQAFVSPSYPPIATLGVNLNLNRELALNYPKSRFKVHTKLNTNVAIVHLTPVSMDGVVNILDVPSIEGVILKVYGAGNAPSKNKAFYDAIERAVKRGVVVVVISQCMKGNADLGIYATGNGLKIAGAISGHDMTTECATSKLAYLLGKNLSKDMVKKLMETNIRGELSLETDFSVVGGKHSVFVTSL